MRFVFIIVLMCVMGDLSYYSRYAPENVELNILGLYISRSFYRDTQLGTTAIFTMFTHVCGYDIQNKMVCCFATHDRPVSLPYPTNHQNVAMLLFQILFCFKIGSAMKILMGMKTAEHSFFTFKKSREDHVQKYRNPQ